MPPHGTELPPGEKGMISNSTASAARSWRGRSLHAPLDRAGSSSRRSLHGHRFHASRVQVVPRAARRGGQLDKQDQPPHRQPGSWFVQPHSSAVRRAPCAAALGPGYASGGRSSDDEENEEGRQQRQWRQRTLRSLRQDLSHQQRRQQGQAGGGKGWHAGPGGRSSQPRPSDSNSDSDPAWQQAGGTRRGAVRAAPASGSQAPLQRGVRQGGPSIDGKGDGGMHPDGYFLDILKGEMSPACQHMPALARLQSLRAQDPAHLITLPLSPVQRKALWVQTGGPHSRVCPRAWASAPT